jgi:hypothetical protein
VKIPRRRSPTPVFLRGRQARPANEVVIPRFESTVIALSEAIVHGQSSHGTATDALCLRSGHFVLAVHARMPDYLRLPFRLLTLAFDAATLVRCGRPFHRLSLERRIQHIERWRSSRIEAKRRLIEFYESLTLFGFYSDLYGQDYQYARTPDAT